MIARVPSRFPVPLLPVLLVLASLSAPRAETTPPPDVVITGEAGGENDTFGWSVAPAGDVNDDGELDLLVGAPTNDHVAGFAGRAYLFYGPLQANLAASSADAIITAESFGDNLGISVAGAGDVNNDGFDDVIVGARGNDAIGIQAGRVYLFYGPLAGSLAALDADVVISGSDFEELGHSVASAGDLNNDGFGDVVLGASHFSSGLGDERGRAYVFFGPLAGSLASSAADAIINGEFESDHLGSSAAGTRDLNGDDMDDLIVGAPHGPVGFVDPGRAYVFFGPIPLGEMSAAAADVILRGEANNDLFGSSVADAGDVNNDGLGDVIVGAEQTFNDGPGKAHIFQGPLVETASAASAPSGSSGFLQPNATFVGEVSKDSFGNSVSSAGDLNADGFDDVIVGAWDFGDRSGRAYVFYGPMTGVVPAARAGLIITGAAPGDRLGYSVGASPDLNGTGKPDLLVGAPQFLDGDAGKAYVFHDDVVVGVGEPAGGLGADLRLESVPNPFRGATTIRYAVPSAGFTRLAVHDMSGRLVSTLVDRWSPAGEHVASWDGTTAAGARAAAGPYIVTIEAGGNSRAEKIVLLR